MSPTPLKADLLKAQRVWKRLLTSVITEGLIRRIDGDDGQPVAYMVPIRPYKLMNGIPDETTHQKSESCQCGARLSAEGDEATVLAACEGFRVVHHKNCNRIYQPRNEISDRFEPR